MKYLLESNDDIRVVLFETSQESDPLIALFREIAHEQGWNPGDELESYPRSSLNFGLLKENKVIGGLQLVVGNDNEGLPCLTVWPELNLQGRADVADIALLAMDTEHRGQRELFWLLCIEMWRHCRSVGITDLMVEVTPEKLRLYRRLGWPLKVVGEERDHWGEKCIPCRMTLEEVNEEMFQRGTKNPFYQAIFEKMHR